MERTVFPIWNEVKPFAAAEDAQRQEHLTPDAGDNNDRFIDVAEPTLSFFPASGSGRKPAMLVCPGGGYHHLAWSHEGLDIASFLNINGVSAFVLKYRCPDRRQGAIADGARAMRQIRANADKFNVIPDKIGCIGFSAGGHLCASLSAPANPEFYPAQDEIDRFSCRPDFAMLIYPAYLADLELNLAPEFKITGEVPPTLLIQAEDDSVNVECSLAWYLALKRAGVKAEMHLYPEGGHGYALMNTGCSVNNWNIPAADWLRRQTRAE